MTTRYSVCSQRAGLLRCTLSLTQKRPFLSILLFLVTMLACTSRMPRLQGFERPETRNSVFCSSMNFDAKKEKERERERETLRRYFGFARSLGRLRIIIRFWPRSTTVKGRNALGGGQVCIRVPDALGYDRQRVAVSTRYKIVVRAVVKPTDTERTYPALLSGLLL